MDSMKGLKKWCQDDLGGMVSVGLMLALMGMIGGGLYGSSSEVTLITGQTTTYGPQ